MRRLAPLLLFCLPALSSCQQAAAATNQEMARCIGAFEFGKHHWRNQSPPNHRMAVTLATGQIYYVQKLKAAGVADGGQAESIAFATAHVDDPEFMLGLVRACGEKLTRDPEFANQIATLGRIARQVDPVCRSDPRMCARS